MFVTFAIVSLALLLASFFAACGGSKQDTPAPATTPEMTAPPLDGQTLVQERCTQCHNLGQVESARKTADEWKATVERMVGKGAQLNQTEQELLIRYLAEKYPK